MVQSLRENQKRGPGRPKNGFIEDTMRVTGWSRRSVQMYIEWSEKIAPEVMDMLARSDLDKGSYLNSLKNLTHDEQRAKVTYDLEHGLPKRTQSNLSPLQRAWLDADEDERASFRRWIDA